MFSIKPPMYFLITEKIQVFEIQANIFGGTVGLIFDGRDRPITIPTNQEKRLESIRSWSDALNEYPKN